jgi:acyl-CoA thioesterase-2
VTASVESLLASLRLSPTGSGTYRAGNADEAPGVVFGGQLMAQSIVAALESHADKRIKTLQTVFVRGASPELDVEIEVDEMHRGRAFASSTVTIRQGDRLCARSIALMSADEPEVIRHADPMPMIAEPQGASVGTGAWQIEIVGNVDIRDPAAVGPAELDVWTRFDGAPDDHVLSAALAAYATDPFLIATAMRPHPGIGQALAHVTLSTGVIGHTLTFHEPVRASEWMLLSHRSPYAGHGRTYGRADIFQGGQLVGSFVQDNMVRPMSGQGPGRL